MSQTDHTKREALSDAMLTVWAWQAAALAAARERALPDERGEGVVSAAIAVLIMAFLGVLLWTALRSILGDATTNVANQVNQIGR